MFDTGISRRKALQKMGAGAVLVWSAPMVASVASAAPVGSPAPGQRCSTRADCPPPGNQCQFADCVNGVCVTANVPDRSPCSFLGHQGSCEGGVCVVTS